MFGFKCGDVVNRMDFMKFMQTFIVGLYTSLCVFFFGRSHNFRKRVVRTFVGESWGRVLGASQATARIRPSVGSAARSRDAEWIHFFITGFFGIICFQEKNPMKFLESHF